MSVAKPIKRGPATWRISSRGVAPERPGGHHHDGGGGAHGAAEMGSE